VGAEEGFLIIPALVIKQTAYEEAVGTSLVIIAAKSLLVSLAKAETTLLTGNSCSHISAFAIVGIFIGTTHQKKIDGAKLKPAFGCLVR
jgi:uncharacterized membrane protein YfcA